MAKTEDKKTVLTQFHAELRWDLERGEDESFEEFEARVAWLRAQIEELQPNASKYYRIFE